jgi:hypothetical protein
MKRATKMRIASAACAVGAFSLVALLVDLGGIAVVCGAIILVWALVRAP